MGASTHRCEAVQDDGTGGGGGGAAGAYGSAYGANVSGYGGAGAVHYWVHFREAVRLVGIPLPPTALLVFEMYVAKQVRGLGGEAGLGTWVDDVRWLLQPVGAWPLLVSAMQMAFIWLSHA